MNEIANPTVVYILWIAPCDQSVIGPFPDILAANQWSADHRLEDPLFMSPQQILENFHEYGGLPLYHPWEYIG